MKKKEKKEKNKKSKGAFLSFISVGAIATVCLFVCQFLLGDSITNNTTLYENTKINGVDVSNMTLAEAENVVLTDMLVGLSDVEIDIGYQDKNWVLKGTDFEVANKIQPSIQEVARDEKTGNFFENRKKAKEIKENGANYSISYANVISNLETRIDSVISEIEQPLIPASVVFDPNKDDPFEIDRGQAEVVVDKEKLLSDIECALKNDKLVKVEVATFVKEPEVCEEELMSAVSKRSEFSTSYSGSSKARKNNIRLALKNFNGMIVESGESVSFNKTTGDRTEKEGYQKAHTILEGVYVDGVAGGVCQASTTLYNAVLLAGLQVDEVYHHTLPSSYVPLSFDAMVAENYADLVFTNNLQNPIYIKTSYDENNIKVEIYGESMKNLKIERKAEIVKILTHNGDKIVPDTNGQYEDKVLYQGEYLRLKWPREGYESKGYLCFYFDDELVDEKEIRHDFYPAQDGVVVEGVEELGEGMTLPATNFQIVSPQNLSAEKENALKTKMINNFPNEYKI